MSCRPRELYKKNYQNLLKHVRYSVYGINMNHMNFLILKNSRHLIVQNHFSRYKLTFRLASNYATDKEHF